MASKSTLLHQKGWGGVRLGATRDRLQSGEQTGHQPTKQLLRDIASHKRLDAPRAASLVRCRCTQHTHHTVTATAVKATASQGPPMHPPERR
jgi:hypothetical protein